MLYISTDVSYLFLPVSCIYVSTVVVPRSGEDDITLEMMSLTNQSNMANPTIKFVDGRDEFDWEGRLNCWFTCWVSFLT